jgi:predicted nuclease with TOPRIM domain
LKLKLDDTESRLNTKLAATNENLVSARNDVAKCEEKMKGLEDLVKQKETQHFELKGEMAGNDGSLTLEPPRELAGSGANLLWGPYDIIIFKLDPSQSPN